MGAWAWGNTRREKETTEYSVAGGLKTGVKTDEPKNEQRWLADGTFRERVADVKTTPPSAPCFDTAQHDTPEDGN